MDQTVRCSRKHFYFINKLAYLDYKKAALVPMSALIKMTNTFLSFTKLGEILAELTQFWHPAANNYPIINLKNIHIT